MSDALTDIASDAKKAREIGEYLEGVFLFLKGKLPVEEVKKRAKTASSGSYGYWTSPVDLVTGLDETLKKLKAGDKKTWARFLYAVHSGYWVDEFYKLSPWVGKVLIFVYYEQITTLPKGWVSEEIVTKIIEKAGFKSTDDWNRYWQRFLIVLDESSSEVFWIKKIRLQVRGAIVSKKVETKIMQVR